MRELRTMERTGISLFGESFCWRSEGAFVGGVKELSSCLSLLFFVGCFSCKGERPEAFW